MINFRMNQKRSLLWNWFAMLSTYLRFSYFVLFHWKKNFFKEGLSHGEKKIYILLDAMKTRLFDLCRRKNRTINQQVSWRHDAYLHNALHPLERQVVIELHNIYICVSYPCHKLGCIPASWWPWSHFVHRVQFVFNVEGSLGWENR